MIDDDQRRDCVKEGTQFLQYIRLEIDDHMPSELLGAAGNFQELVFRRIVHQPLEKIEADAANTTVVKSLQLAIGNCGIDHSDAASLAVRSGDRVQRRGIVVAVAARLHADVW